MKKLFAFLIVMIVALGTLSGCSSWYQKTDSGNMVLITDRAMLKTLLSSRYTAYIQRNSGATKDSIAAEGSYSSTNTQVEGVDEGDIVKTDGKLIIHISNDTVRIIDATTLKVVGKVAHTYTDKDTKFYRPSEIFLYKDKLVVLGSISQYNGNVYPMMKDSMIGRPFWIGYQDAYAAVYDVSDPAKPVLLKNYEITGAFYSARLTGNELMLISNQYNIIVYAQDGKETINDPMVKETVTGSIVSAIGSKTAFALPGKSGDSFVNIMKVDLDTVATAKLSSYLGSIQTIFADKANLLIAQYRFVVTNQATGEGKTVTDILRFDINSLELKADASISGYLLNQFSFDIYANTVRVAATDWAGGKTTNSVYVFDMALEPQSSIMNLAAGETIRAVRFIEDKGYVVTFQNIDPLFVIDLSNPKAIKVTGELKIPGFSTYLHPLSKTVLFGIAEDLEVVQVKNPDGTVWNNMNRFGIKLSLFDVSDPTAPKELASLRVLGQNGYTEASYNHKTVVYDTERELLYLPYTDSDYTSQVCQTYPGKEGTSGTYTYCSYKMESGIKVVHVTKTGITLVKTIVVATNNDYTNLVSRVLYVGDKLFAITSDSVLIYDRDSYAPISTIKY